MASLILSSCSETSSPSASAWLNSALSSDVMLRGNDPG
eukprot:CAMPEP_0176172510 /NCGR_PEP_ID=MMETSP0120_2-20121206/88389_1 /TAXON_ID=160619 /ORGANISM="Kryptoperidinium foliaceum, Strain CCMP 1326" /LENGTH=37 /DNA_ID= /DNA_START= /DNA_END= /DNA_ORIENTATION=